jgi:hypothetical protein
MPLFEDKYKELVAYTKNIKQLIPGIPQYQSKAGEKDQPVPDTSVNLYL